MKYVIIIPDGAADHPLDDLDGKTPFETARKPNTDQLSIEGRQGTVVTTPEGMPCGSDTCTMSLIGYDPLRYHTGRAPLEAEALGIELGEHDWVFRVNLVTVIDGLMQDHSAGQIRSEEGRTLLEDLAARVTAEGLRFHPGVSYRNIMVDTSGDRPWDRLRSTPPHDIPGEAIKDYLPSGGSASKVLRELIELSAEVFADHEINQTRRELGEPPVTHVWPWGQGRRPAMPSFESRFGLRGAMITAVDLLAGLAGLIGWDRLDVPGQTSYHDNDYDAAGRYAIEALDDYDIVCVHVEAPDEASHSGDAATKVQAIERMDQAIVAPIRHALDSRDPDYRILYLPDHYTSVATRKHDPTPVPFAICGKHVTSVLQRPFMERNADESDLHIDFGHELMEYFLFSGLPGEARRGRMQE